MTPDDLIQLRPELHRYCARLMGSIVDGEDIVQETLARAQGAPEMTRPLLFRIAHNAAIDALRRHERRFTEPVAEVPEAADAPDRADRIDPGIVHLALAVFQRLPVAQRSAVILKDVLGCTLEEIAESTGATVLAVKAALVRGRRTLREHADDPTPAPVLDPAERIRLHDYAARFNARDWDGLRALLTDESRLDLVAKAQRRGKAVGEYYERYAALPELRAVAGTLDGRPAIAVYAPPDSPVPGSFVLITWAGDRIDLIRDFRYVPYIAAEFATTSFVPDQDG